MDTKKLQEVMKRGIYGVKAVLVTMNDEVEETKAEVERVKRSIRPIKRDVKLLLQRVTALLKEAETKGKP